MRPMGIRCMSLPLSTAGGDATASAAGDSCGCGAGGAFRSMRRAVQTRMFTFTQFLGVAVAVFAAAIAWALWYTTRSKFVLDLFNLRMEVYDRSCAVIANVMRAGTATTQGVLDLARQADRAKFLFGDDVYR